MPKSKIQQLMDARKGLDVASPVFAGTEPELPAADLQEQSAHSEDSAETAAGNKIDWGAIASNLAQKIDNTKQQINLLQKEIELSQSRIRESEEAYQLVVSPPKWAPKPGEFELFDRLGEVMSQQEDQTQRAEKLRQVQQAITLGQQLVAQKQRQIALLEAELRDLQEELSWATRYTFHVKKFEPGYQPPTPQKDEIKRHTRNLFDAQKLLKEAEEKASQSPSDVDKWIRGTIYKTPSEAIATFRQSVERQQQQLETASRRNERHFRQYIITRVNSDPILQHFIQVQESYQKALGQLAETFQNNGTSLGLSSEEIGKIVNLKLPSIKMDETGRVSVI
jgi:hypothetical protein